MSDVASNPPVRHRGLTLVEVILVLALLVVIGAISAPLLQSTLSRAELHSAGDLLRGAWSKARLAAMQSGQVYAFRYEPNGSRFQIISFSTLGAGEGAPLEPEDADAEHATIDIFRLSKSRLPDGVTFTGGDVSSSNQLSALLPDAGDGPWSAPVLFRPDGTTSDASIILTNKREESTRITLRGLTGISNATDLSDEAQQ